jgi:hypothetical protein
MPFVMSTTLVIQSHREPLPLPWLQACLDSVSGWARANCYDYRYLGDEIFTQLEPDLLERIGTQRVIASDLARLASLRRGLAEGYDCVVWCDADFLIFDPARFVLPQAEFALGREVWVQPDQRHRPRAYVKVHNALLMFRRGNSFLDFYHATAERLLRLNQGSMPPQFIGPKLLTALHNIALCPVMECAAMLSPAVMRERLAGQGEALRLFRQKSSMAPAGANLCSSLAQRAGLGDADMDELIRLLLAEGM